MSTSDQALALPVDLAPTLRVPRPGLVVLLGLLVCTCPGALAQEGRPPPLRLNGIYPSGVRSSATESRGLFEFSLTNLTDMDRQARVILLYEGSNVQYGRDVWVPARSSLSTWMLVGPVTSRQTQILLYDRTAGEDKLILPPAERRIRSGGVPYRKREPTTAVLLDEDLPGPPVFGQLPGPEPEEEEVFRLVHTFRHTANLSESVQRVRPGPLPPTPEAFDGIDHFVIASGRLARDPVGLRALRQWLERGGKVWLLLDKLGQAEADPLLEALLGEALDFTVVERASLTTITVATPEADPEPPVQHDRPVDLVRVLLPSRERKRHTVDGWPTWFTRRVGRGEIVVTTLGPRGWYRPRTAGDPKSRFKDFPSLPMPTASLELLADELRAPPEGISFDLDAFRPVLTQEIGYSVIGRGTVALIFGVFLLSPLALAAVLRRSRRPGLLGWLAPVTALVAAGVFVALGTGSRQAVPPTVAVAQVVNAVSGADEAPIHGLLAVYRPDSGPMEAGAERGGFFELDREAVGEQARLIQTDTGAWHWEGLALPAGERFGSFRYTAPSGAPLSAVARPVPEGLEGKLEAGPFSGDVADAVLFTPGGRTLAVRLRPDGSFRIGPRDLLPAGQFLAEAVLSDRQQQRQTLYRRFLAPTDDIAPHGRSVLLAWANPVETHFQLVPGARTVGMALLVIPLELKRPEGGGSVTIPGPLVSCRRVVSGGETRLPRSSRESTSVELRFRIPPAVLPFKVERARLVARIKAPSRRVTFSGQAAGRPVELLRVDSPLDPIRLDIAEKEILLPDASGGVHLTLAVSDPLQGGGVTKAKDQAKEKWALESIELEITGRAE